MEKIKKMCHESLEKIIKNNNKQDMIDLGDMLCEMISHYETNDKPMYNKMASKMFEMSNGKTLTKEMAEEWVKSMPYGEHWTMEQTNNAMKSMNSSYDPIAFYVYANKMYNYHYNTVKANDSLALKLAIDKMQWITENPHMLYDKYKRYYLGVE